MGWGRRRLDQDSTRRCTVSAARAGARSERWFNTWPGTVGAAVLSSVAAASSPGLAHVVVVSALLPGYAVTAVGK